MGATTTAACPGTGIYCTGHSKMISSYLTSELLNTLLLTPGVFSRQGSGGKVAGHTPHQVHRAGAVQQEKPGAPGGSAYPLHPTGALVPGPGRPHQSRAGCGPRRVDGGQAGGDVPPQGAAPKRADPGAN